MFKRIWLVFALMILLAAGCGSDEKDSDTDKDDTPNQPATVIPTLTRYTDAAVTHLGPSIEAALLATYPDFAETNDDGETELAPSVLAITLSPTGQTAVLWLINRVPDATTYMVCIYDLPSSAVTCNPHDDRFGTLDDGLMVWSADGRYLALHNEWAIRMDDPDILLVDVEQAKLLNLTGLPMEANDIMDIYQGEMVVVDYAPFWSADGAYLYFFRTQPAVSAEDDRMSDWPPLTLMRIRVGEWTFEEVMPVPDPITFQRLIATNQIDAAPDGKQVAALLMRLPNENGTTDLYRFNIETGKAELWFDQADLIATLLPSWVDATRTLLYPMDVEWSADGRHVVVALNADLLTASLMTYGLIDVATNTLTSLAAWEEVTDMRAFYEVNPVIPKRVLFVPNGSGLVSINAPVRVVEGDTYSVTEQALVGTGETLAVATLALSQNQLRFIPQARYASAIDTLGAQQSALLHPPNSGLAEVYLLTLAE